MNRLSSATEVLKNKFLPLLLVAGIGAASLTACSSGDSEKPTTVKERMATLFEQTSDLCAQDAQQAFDAEYKDVENDPATEVDEAFLANKKKTTEGKTEFANDYKECIDVSFEQVAASLVELDKVPTPAGMPQVTTTTVEG